MFIHYRVGNSKFYTFLEGSSFRAFLDVKRKSKKVLGKAISYSVSHFSSKLVFAAEI
jgi:hypothetical protein